MITVEGELEFGLVVDGVCHRHFVMREASVADVIAAAEKAPVGVTEVRLRIYRAAEQLVSIGDVTDIDADMLFGLPDDDVFPLLMAQDDLQKKRKAGNYASGHIG